MTLGVSARAHQRYCLGVLWPSFTRVSVDCRGKHSTDAIIGLCLQEILESLNWNFLKIDSWTLPNICSGNRLG